MISDITPTLSAIEALLKQHFKTVFTETKTNLSPSEFPAVVMTVDSGEITMKFDGVFGTNVTLQIDVLDRSQTIQAQLVTHTNQIVEALSPYVEIDGKTVKAYPQSFTFSFDEEDSRIGTSSIIYNIQI